MALATAGLPQAARATTRHAWYPFVPCVQVAIRLSPFGHYLMTPDPHTYAAYSYLLTELSKLGLAYVVCAAAVGRGVPRLAQRACRPSTPAW